jgi:hypothetical protein
MLNRYSVGWITNERGERCLAATRDGEVRVSGSFDCTLIDGLTLGRDDLTLGVEAGPMVGSIIGDASSLNGGAWVVGADIGLLVMGDLAVGIAPHWVVGGAAQDATSWGFAIYASIDLASIGDAIGLDFSNAMQESINESERESTTEQ